MQWWYDYFRDVDAFGPSFPEWLAEDICLQFNDLPMVEGKPRVLAFFGDMLQSVKRLIHDHGALICTEEEGAGTAVVTYVLQDETHVSFRCVSVIQRSAGKIKRLEIYGNFTPVFEAFHAYRCRNLANLAA